MHQTAVGPYYLRVLDAESGLKVETMLDPWVSPLSAEAMNLILQKDGITAYIGKRSEFGLLESVLEKRRTRDGQHCWSSSPASTILSKLGLCQNMLTPAQSVRTGHGSPLVIHISVLIWLWEKLPEQVFGRNILLPYRMGCCVFAILGGETDNPLLPESVIMTHNDVHEALSYLYQEDNHAESYLPSYLLDEFGLKPNPFSSTEENSEGSILSH
jgi:hypothetical protein